MCATVTHCGARPELGYPRQIAAWQRDGVFLRFGQRFAALMFGGLAGAAQERCEQPDRPAIFSRFEPMRLRSRSR